MAEQAIVAKLLWPGGALVLKGVEKVSKSLGRIELKRAGEGRGSRVFSGFGTN